MTAPNRRPAGLHVFITHEFYPKRGGIATFVEQIARAACEDGHAVEGASRPCHSRYRDRSVAPRSVTSDTHTDRGSTNEDTASGVEVWAQALPRGVAEKQFPFRVRRLPLRGTHDFRCIFALARVLFAERRRLREASVYLVEPGPILAFLWLQFFGALRPRELCLTFHGSEILRFARCPLRRVLLRRLITRAARVSTLTHTTRDLLFERFPEARARFVLTPGAVVDPFFEQATKAGALAADGGGSPACGKRERDKQRLVVLTVGRLHPRKGQLHTLAALAALPPELQQKIEYWLVGSAGTGRVGKRYAERLRELAGGACSIDADAGACRPGHSRCRDTSDAPSRLPAARGSEGGGDSEREESGLVVRFLGNVPDEALGAVYAQADIFALTSVAHGTSIEGFGLVYLEASAHGLPIIAHDIGGVAEAVSDGHTGLLVPPDDKPDALRDAFARLIEDAELRARLGAAGPAWARRQSWRDSAAALLGGRVAPAIYVADTKQHASQAPC